MYWAGPLASLRPMRKAVGSTTATSARPVAIAGELSTWRQPAKASAVSTIENAPNTHAGQVPSRMRNQDGTNASDRPAKPMSRRRKSLAEEGTAGSLPGSGESCGGLQSKGDDDGR